MAKAKKKNTLEKDIRKEICKYLEKEGYLFWRFEPTKYVPSIGRYIRSEFTPTGLPDIMVLVKGKFIGLETKRPSGGVKSGDQILMKKRFQALGAEYYFVRSVDNVKKALKGVID